MKILVFTDIHGCYNALTSLVNCDDFKNADKVIFLGDATIGFSRPNECIELINSLSCICIVGNNDQYVYDKIPLADMPDFSSQKLKQLDWMQQTVTPQNKAILKSWKKSLKLVIENKTFHFTHYPWEICDGEESVITSPIQKNLHSRKEMFKNIDADYYIFGHEHRSSYFIDETENKHYYCLGTIGLKSPGSYLVITTNNSKINLEEKFINFNVNEEVDLIENAGYPYNKDKIKKQNN